MNGVVALSIPGYGQGLGIGIPATNDLGGTAATQAVNYRIPPAVWMVVFLVLGYVGLRMILE